MKTRTIGKVIHRAPNVPIGGCPCKPLIGASIISTTYGITGLELSLVVRAAAKR